MSLFSEQARSQHLPLLLTMDFPSEDWVYLDEFDTAPTNMRGDNTLELYAQLRPTGRMLDHFRCVLWGSKHLEINASLMDMIPNECFRGWLYRTQKSQNYNQHKVTIKVTYCISHCIRHLTHKLYQSKLQPAYSKIKVMYYILHCIVI